MLILQSIILGIPQGALYGLMALGISLIFKTVGVMNFSHGHAGMIGAYVAFSLYLITNNFFISIVLAIVFGFSLGLLIEKFLMRPIKHLSHGAMLIITLGLLMVFEGIAIIIWGTEFKMLPEIISIPPFILNLKGSILVMPGNDILITIIAIFISLSLAIFLKFTKIGTAIRARSQDEIGSDVVGINVNLVDSIVWGIGIALSVIVAILVSPKTYVNPNMMVNMQLYGFTAGVLGGFSSFFGAIVGGLILGILEKIVGMYISPDYQLSIILLLIIVVLVFKPSGLFGKRSEGRV